jgi:hypothetical protein
VGCVVYPACCQARALTERAPIWRPESGQQCSDSRALRTVCARRPGAPDDSAPEPCGAGMQVSVQGPDDAERQAIRVGAQAAASRHQCIDDAASRQCQVGTHQSQACDVSGASALALEPGKAPGWLLLGPTSRRAPAREQRNRDRRNSERRERPRLHSCSDSSAGSMSRRRSVR